MTSIAEDIRDYLVLQASLSGRTIKIGSLPEEIDTEILAVLETPSNEPLELVMGASVSARISYRKPIVQVLVRGPVDSYEATRATIELVYIELAAASGISINSNNYDFIVASTEPYALNATALERVLWGCDFVCWRRGL